jgi:hypothetical protein
MTESRPEPPTGQGRCAERVATVYVVFTRYWEDVEIDGVYDSLEAAKASARGDWHDAADGGAYQVTGEYGLSVAVERFAVQSAK